MILLPKILRRCKREPVSKIIGAKRILGLDLLVSPYVLDPRPDSETLIEAAIKQFPDKNRTSKYFRFGVLVRAAYYWQHSKNGLIHMV